MVRETKFYQKKQDKQNQAIGKAQIKKQKKIDYLEEEVEVFKENTVIKQIEFKDDEETFQSVIKLDENINKQIEKHENKQLEVTMKKDSSKDVFSFNVPRYIKVVLSDGTQELAEVQDWLETVRLRRDMTSEEQKIFDNEFAEWEKNPKNHRRYIFNDEEIRLIKYCLKCYLTDFYFHKVIQCYKNGEFDKIINDPQVIKFVDEFLSRKAFNFILMLPSVKTTLSKKQFLHSIHLETVLNEKDITFKPLTKERHPGAAINVILQFDNLDKFKFAQLVLLNNSINFEQSKLAEETIKVFTELFNLMFNNKATQQLLKDKHNSPEILSTEAQIKQENIHIQEQLLSEKEMEIEENHNKIVNIVSPSNSTCNSDEDSNKNNRKATDIGEKITKSDLCLKISNCLKLLQILKNENKNAFMTCKNHRFGIKTSTSLLNNLLSDVNKISDESQQKKIIESTKITIKGMDNFINFCKNKFDIQIQQ